MSLKTFIVSLLVSSETLIKLLSASRAKARASCKSVEEEEEVHRKKIVASKALQWPKPSQP